MSYQLQRSQRASNSGVLHPRPDSAPCTRVATSPDIACCVVCHVWVSTKVNYTLAGPAQQNTQYTGQALCCWLLRPKHGWLVVHRPQVCHLHFCASLLLPAASSLAGLLLMSLHGRAAAVAI